MFASTFSPVTVMRRALLALALAASSLASAQTMHVELDTSAYAAGGAGWLDLQFNPGNLPVVAASAVISNLVGFGGAMDVVLSGDVQQQGAGYLFGNSTDFNDLFHMVSFGGKLSFDVTLGGLADPSPAAVPSKFSVSLYAADGFTQLGNVAPDGSVLSLTWTPAASGAGSVGVGYVDAGLAAVAPVPEPSAWLMLGAGLALVGALARRRQGAVLLS